ncbi:hypothetical protein [Neorhizobium sp. T25_27]|uniref:hypothetical protein n=1 Tax=Neorhizobium sp. T25_27 TaxID=2093831 RepID=UPI00155E270D|nr:hypothetical protein [Neorhizobium sp. T25_27]
MKHLSQIGKAESYFTGDIAELESGSFCLRENTLGILLPSRSYLAFVRLRCRRRRQTREDAKNEWNLSVKETPELKELRATLRSQNGFLQKTDSCADNPEAALEEIS